MPKVVDADQQRTEIRTAARAVFAERGVRGTGLAHVADAAGMGRSSLYHYYPDKDSLLADLVHDLLQQERTLFRACLRGPGSALQRVHRLLDANLALFDEWAELAGMMIELRLNDARRYRRYFRDFRKELGAALARGQRAGEIRPGLDPTHCAAALIGTIDGLVLQYFLDPAAFSAEVLRDTLGEVADRILAP